MQQHDVEMDCSRVGRLIGLMHGGGKNWRALLSRDSVTRTRGKVVNESVYFAMESTMSDVVCMSRKTRRVLLPKKNPVESFPLASSSLNGQPHVV